MPQSRPLIYRRGEAGAAGAVPSTIVLSPTSALVEVRSASILAAFYGEVGIPAIAPPYSLLFYDGPETGNVAGLTPVFGLFAHVGVGPLWPVAFSCPALEVPVRDHLIVVRNTVLFTGTVVFR